MSLPDRFWDKVHEEPTSGCWLWLAAENGHGYGAYKHEGRQKGAHRVAYEALVGPVPRGLDLDHRCRTRCCVNPAHLEPVTRQTNLLRGHTRPAENAKKTLCFLGHPFTYVDSQGARRCEVCDRRRSKESRDRRLRDQAA